MRISDWSSDVCSSDLSKVTAGQFIETEDGARVFFAEEPTRPGEEMGNVIARVIDPEWPSVITAESARIQNEKHGDRFLVLSAGHRYDLKPCKPDFRQSHFLGHVFRLQHKTRTSSNESVWAGGGQ